LYWSGAANTVLLNMAATYAAKWQVRVGTQEGNIYTKEGNLPSLPSSPPPQQKFSHHRCSEPFLFINSATIS